jgi:hypothetical protein
MGKATSPDWESNSTPQQVRELTEAKIDLRKAARVVADCPHCVEGWHYVDPNNDAKGVVRCPSCWEGYTNAFEFLRNLDSKFFVEDAMTNFKPDVTDKLVDLEQIKEYSKALERVAMSKRVEL